MVKRGLSAIVGIGVFLALCFGGLLPFAIGATLIAALATQEWISAYQHAQKVEAKAGDAQRMPARTNQLNIFIAIAGISLPLFAAFGYDPAGVVLRQLVFREAIAYDKCLAAYGFLLAAPVLLFTLLTLRAAKNGRALGGLRRGYGWISLLYIGCGMASLVHLRMMAGKGVPSAEITGGPLVLRIEFGFVNVHPFGWTSLGAWLMLFVAVCVWMTDTGAYIIGKKWGRHKLAPRLSPGKTVEGSLGGLCAALLTGALFGLWIHLPLRDGLAIGFLAGTMGQTGDLFESALKREIGIKDFGSIMPGHGGALDRFDSLLFVTPLALCYLHFVAGL